MTTNIAEVLKLAAKPVQYDNDEKTWLEFRFKLENYLTLVDERYVGLLLDAESQPVANLPTGTEESAVTIRILSHTLYALLATLTTGRSLRLVQRVPNRNGFEAWRQPLQHVPEMPEFAFLISLDRSKWPRWLLWHGWLLGLNGMMNDKPWALSFGELAAFHLERCLGAYPVGFAAAWTPPDYWDADDIALEIPEHPNIWTDGSREDFFSIGVFEVATFLLLRLLLIIRFGERQRSMVMLGLSVAVLFYLSLGFCRLFSVLNSGVLLLLCRITVLVIWVSTTLMWFVALVVCLIC